jgi:hypothetical protein
MERNNNNTTLIPAFLKDMKKRFPVDVVEFGRWAGVFVLISAPGWAIWNATIFAEALQETVAIFWGNLISAGSFGVIIILLAEVVDKLRERRR